MISHPLGMVRMITRCVAPARSRKRATVRGGAVVADLAIVSPFVC